MINDAPKSLNFCEGWAKCPLKLFAKHMFRYIYFNEDNFYFDCGIPHKIGEESKWDEVYKDIQFLQIGKNMHGFDHVSSVIPKEVKVLNLEHLKSYKQLMSMMDSIKESNQNKHMNTEVHIEDL